MSRLWRVSDWWNSIARQRRIMVPGPRGPGIPEPVAQPFLDAFSGPEFIRFPPWRERPTLATSLCLRDLPEPK